ncbi:hypothetical protein LCGC14_1944510 [marine sediment metagenome]|uniref:Glycosyltransferase 2-like domain-containing protein n=1 Tax=marine sediment metagenome TaxID=412755 RepID=A0A0F9HXJ7_9ZZZZ
MNSLTIILPTYNEKDSIELLLPAVAALGYPIIVIDDNSPDGTAKVVREMNYPNVNLKVRKGQRGLGAAIRYGAEQAKTRYVAVMDTDGQHKVTDLIHLIDIMFLGHVDPSVVLGSRLMLGGSIEGLPRYRKVVTIILNWLGSLRAQTRASDYLTGFFISRRKLVTHTTENGFKILYDILKHNKLVIKELPITLYKREYGESKANWRELQRYLKLVFS